jgi:hypothetical protein
MFVFLSVRVIIIISKLGLNQFSDLFQRRLEVFAMKRKLGDRKSLEEDPGKGSRK